MKLISLLAIASAIGGVGAAPALAQQSPEQAPTPAPAAPEKHDSGFYLGGGINLYFLDRDYASEGLPVIFEDQPSPGAFMLRAGYAFNANVAIEVEAGVGGARQEYSTNGVSTDGKIGIDSPLGAYAVFSLPMGSGGSYLLGKVGYVSAKISREYQGVDAPDLDVSGAAFGIGGGWRDNSWDYRMEYSFMSGGDSGDGGVLGMFVINHF